MTHYRRWVGGRRVGWSGWWVGSQRQVKLSVRTVWTSYESKKCQPYAQTCLEGLRDVSLPSKNALARSSKKRSFFLHSCKILQYLVGYCIPARCLQYPTRSRKILQEYKKKDLFLEDLARALLLGSFHWGEFQIHTFHAVLSLHGGHYMEGMDLKFTPVPFCQL